MEKKLSLRVGTVILGITILSGCKILNKNNVVINPDNIPKSEVEEQKDTRTIDLEDKVELVTFDDFRSIDGSIYTYDDLKHINSLVIKVDDDFDYSFLNELHNLEFLHIDDYSSGQSLNDIDASNFKEKMSITITMDPEVGEFNKKRYPFLRDIKEINNLILGSDDAPLAIDDDYLEELDNVHCLYLSVNQNSDIDYDDLEHLDFLYIDGDTEYVNRKDIRELEDEGVKVKIIKK